MSQTIRILLALLLGLTLGMIGAQMGWQHSETLMQWADVPGIMWLNALKMTIIPLIVALLITGIGRTADSVRGGGLAARSVTTYLVLIILSSLAAAIVVPLMLQFWPLSADAAASLRAGLGSAAADIPDKAPSIPEILKATVPTNVVGAAGAGEMLPLIIFVFTFAFAITRLEPALRERLVGFFDAIEKAMLIVIHWVLWVAPIGVFSLAFMLGISAGTAALGALLHYIILVSSVGLIVWAFAYPTAVFGGGRKLGAFVNAILPAQAVALSTQSSLASMPAMIEGSQKLGVPLESAGVTLPIAVTIFRATGPAMNFTVAIYAAHMMGMELSFVQIALGFIVAALTAPAAVSLPGQVSFFTSCAPICAVMGVPLAPLAILVAVEMIPDLVRTVANVTWDVAATTAITRKEADAAPGGYATEP